MNPSVEEIFKHLWQEIRGNSPGEPNLYDFRLMAQTLRLHYVDKMLQNTPTYDTGLKIVEYIEDNFFKDAPYYAINHVVRNLSLDDFSKRMGDSARDLQLEGYLHGGVTKVLSAAFYTWYGCLSMAKLTRPEGSDHIQYTPEMRSEGYEDLRSEWEETEKIGNPWIKFGVSLAKNLEEKRKKNDPKKTIVDNWVPKDSPYWSKDEK